jgi:hypothetical protein
MDQVVLDSLNVLVFLQKIHSRLEIDRLLQLKD